MISRNHACRLLHEMVSIPSFSGAEHEIARFLVGEMTTLGLQAHVDGAGNVVGETGCREGPLVVLLGHIDTVGSFLPVIARDGKLFGRGSVDAKGPFASFVCSAANSRHLPLRIVVIGAVEEETTSRGAKYVLANYDPSVVIIGEPSGADAVVVGYKGQVKGSYTVLHPAGHGAGPVSNAMHDLVSFWNALETYCQRAARGQRLFEQLTPSILRMSGDAQHAHMDFDVRIPPGFEINGLIAHISSLRNAGNLRFMEIMPASVHSQNTAPARSLRRAIRTSGLDPRIKVKTGTCDMNTVSVRWAAPCIAYGPGDSALDHTAEEHVRLDEYWSAIGILSETLQLLSVELSGSRNRRPAANKSVSTR